MVFWRQLPRLLELPSPRDIARSNLKLVQANESLETTIAWRTHDLERANQRFEQALSRSNITVYTQDTDLRFTWIHNPRLGLRQEEMIGRRTSDFLREGTDDKSLALKMRALATGLTVSGTVAVATPNEGTLYLDMTASPTVNREGEIDGVLCTAFDVTEKRLFEVRLASMAAQLATGSHRFELALENSGTTVFEQDRDLRYTYIYNPPPGTRAGGLPRADRRGNLSRARAAAPAAGEAVGCWSRAAAKPSRPSWGSADFSASSS